MRDQSWIRRDDISHTYYDPDGVVVPGVTTIIEACSPMAFHFGGEQYMERGTDAHSATEIWDLHAKDPARHPPLDLSSLTDEIAPYMRSYLLWLELINPVILEVEQFVGDRSLGFAGQLDRIVRIERQTGILDIKSGQPDPRHGLQLAAYQIGYYGINITGEPERRRRWGLYLQADGSPARMKEYHDGRDWPVFLAMLTSYKWRSMHGCLT